MFRQAFPVVDNPMCKWMGSYGVSVLSIGSVSHCPWAVLPFIGVTGAGNELSCMSYRSFSWCIWYLLALVTRRSIFCRNVMSSPKVTTTSNIMTLHCMIKKMCPSELRDIHKWYFCMVTKRRKCHSSVWRKDSWLYFALSCGGWITDRDFKVFNLWYRKAKAMQHSLLHFHERNRKFPLDDALCIFSTTKTRWQLPLITWPFQRNWRSCMGGLAFAIRLQPPFIALETFHVWSISSSVGGVRY